MARGQARKTQVQEQEKEQPKAQGQPKAQAKARPKEKAKAEVRQEAREQGNDVVLAMDIGTRSIIGMVGVATDGKINVIAVEKEEHAERAMIDGQIENIEKVAALAGKVKKRLEDKTGIRLTRVCVAAAGRALRTKRAEYELELSGSQLIDDEIISRLEAGAITRAEEAFDAENEAAEDSRRFYLVGYTACQYFLDEYMISNLKDHKGKKVKVDLIATFLPSEVVESLYTTMNKIGLEVASLTLEPIAAINAAIPENIRLLNLVLVDIGAGTSDIAACMGGSITGYTMATVAGDEITETIMKQYLVDFSTAENIKARLDIEEEIAFKDILGMDYMVSRDEIFQCIQGTSGILCKEIANKVLEINGTAPSALFLAGGGSKLAGLKEGLTAALGMAPGRVAIAGNYFNTNAFSEEYDLNNPEYATPLGIAVSSGLNMINDSFRVILNNKPAKLFRSGSFTALNLLMMNGYNFRDLLGRAGQNLGVIVNGARKIFYGSASEPATLLINQREGKLSDIIHAGDSIDFVPAVPGIAAKACLGDIDGAADCVDITLNGIHVPLKTPLKSGDVIHMILPRKTEVKEEKVMEEEVKASPKGDGDEEAGPEAKKEDGSSGMGDTDTGAGAASGPAFGEGPEGRPEAGDNGPGQAMVEAPWTEPVKEEGKETGIQGAGRSQEVSGDRAAGGMEEPPGVLERETIGMEGNGHSGTAFERLGRFGAKVTPMMGGQAAADVPEKEEGTVGIQNGAFKEDKEEVPEKALYGENSGTDGEDAMEGSMAGPLEEDTQILKSTVVFQLNGSPIELPVKEDGRPYYLMDMIQYSGIDLERPRGVVKLTVNGAPGMFQQALKEGDVVCIEEEKR